MVRDSPDRLVVDIVVAQRPADRLDSRGSTRQQSWRPAEDLVAAATRSIDRTSTAVSIDLGSRRPGLVDSRAMVHRSRRRRSADTGRRLAVLAHSPGTASSRLASVLPVPRRSRLVVVAIDCLFRINKLFLKICFKRIYQ